MRIKNRFFDDNFKIHPLGVNERYIFIFYENFNFTYEVNYIMVSEYMLNRILLKILFIKNTCCKKEEENVFCRKFHYTNNSYIRDYIVIADSYSEAKALFRKYSDRPITYYRKGEKWTLLIN